MGDSAASFFKIPGNIKQQFVPFAVEPSQPINKKATDSTQLAGATPQFFSFKPDRVKTKYGKIQACPSSTFEHIVDDISYKLLYKRNSEDGKLLQESIDMKCIFNSIPSIQIREYLPDTALDQAINFIKSLMEVGDSLKVAVKEKKEANATKGTQGEVKDQKPEDKTSTKDHATNVFNAAKWTLKYIIGSTEPNLMKSIIASVKDKATKFYTNGDDKLKNYILNFPYVMYYRFLGTVTTNIYELPCNVAGNVMYNSSGEKGWDSGKIDLLFGPLAQNQLLKTFFGNVRVHFMKTWNAADGSDTPNEAISINVELFNDTEDAAINNFIFVNTLIANNKWVQYNMFEHAPSLYDIKIEGYERLFACTGKFKVVGKGVLRDIPNSMMTKLCALKTSCVSITEKDIANQKLIKIPDIYSIEMVFSSIIPDNFNTWMYKYSQNLNQIEEYTAAYQPSIVCEMLNKAIKDFATEFSNRWKHKNWN